MPARPATSSSTRLPCEVAGRAVVGDPGTGKSAFAKSLGQETQRPTLTLDVTSLLGSLVGQTEERTRNTLDIVDRMQPAVLFMDEVDKALAGATGTGVSSWRYLQDRIRGTHEILALPELMQEAAQET